MRIIKNFQTAIQAVNAVMDFLFPELCLICGSIILPKKRIKASSYPLCAACAHDLPAPVQPRCGVCSRPLISEKELCMDCRRLSSEKRLDYQKSEHIPVFPFERNVSVFVYTDPGIAELVVSYKGRKRRSLAVFFAEKLLWEYKALYDGLPLVPVPCRKKSLQKRGFDPVVLLCRQMKKLDKRIQVLCLLGRGGKTREQKRLNRDERQKNLKGALVPLVKRTAVLPQAVVLLDDVFTTGATAAACAEVLKSIGIERVYVLTLALD